MHVWRSRLYQCASADERRLIEIRYGLARKLQSTRFRQRITQKQLAQRLRVAAPLARAARLADIPPPPGEHRFLRKGSERLPRLR
jgi:hypothetical protein